SHSRRLDPRYFHQTQLGNLLSPQYTLEGFSVHVLGESLLDPDVLWDLEASNLALAVAFQLVGGYGRAGLGDDPGGNDLAILGVGQTGHRDLGHRRVTEQECLDLGGIDVLPAPDDQLTDPTDDPVVPVLAAVGQVAGVEPAL